MITWLVIIGTPAAIVGGYVARLMHWARIGGASWSGALARWRP